MTDLLDGNIEVRTRYVFPASVTPLCRGSAVQLIVFRKHFTFGTRPASISCRPRLRLGQHGRGCESWPEGINGRTVTNP